MSAAKHFGLENLGINLCRLRATHLLITPAKKKKKKCMCNLGLLICFLFFLVFGLGETALTLKERTLIINLQELFSSQFPHGFGP